MKCFTCNRKIQIHLENQKCRCNLSFCNKHFLPEAHNCSYYYDENGKHKIIESPLTKTNTNTNKKMDHNEA